jgi:hypothetical protein
MAPNFFHFSLTQSYTNFTSPQKKIYNFLTLNMIFFATFFEVQFALPKIRATNVPHAFAQ